MNRRFSLVVLLYLPHLFEEALTGMHDDAPIAAAYAVFASLGPRHAAYLVFQVTFALALAAMALAAWGERSQRLLLGVLAIALVGEGHHLVRAISTLSYNPGLVTALPLPFAGAWLLRDLVSPRKVPACSPT